MKNLAHDKNCDDDLHRELQRANIPIEPYTGKPRGAVPYSLIGRLGSFEFHRFWYYWAVRGPTPLEIAKRIYDDPVGRTDIRVAGHCACPPPEPPWIEFYDACGELVHDPDGRQECEWNEIIANGGPLAIIIKAKPRPRFVRDAFAVAASIVVPSYHIDSELGLRIFADAVRHMANQK